MELVAGEPNDIRFSKPVTVVVTRGPTLGEISYALAEITEIKFEITKSSSLKSNLKSEISPQSTRFP